MSYDLDESLASVIRALAESRCNTKLKPHAPFFPSDAVPHSSKFKYKCKKLYEAGLLERSEGYGRWGYRYRVPEPKEAPQ
ncbi:hypothetical protein LCGC14_1982290 [marine sediment metagenome]|uniref:Dam-replacing protein HTH domain-containing protein n=1 Tax=marine sediment metagenome TaxID=412755 RepID=A0A0F9F8Q0_9ZZZZ